MSRLWCVYLVLLIAHYVKGEDLTSPQLHRTKNFLLQHQLFDYDQTFDVAMFRESKDIPEMKRDLASAYSKDLIDALIPDNVSANHANPHIADATLLALKRLNERRRVYIKEVSKGEKLADKFLSEPLSLYMIPDRITLEELDHGPITLMLTFMHSHCREKARLMGDLSYISNTDGIYRCATNNRYASWIDPLFLLGHRWTAYDLQSLIDRDNPVILEAVVQPFKFQNWQECMIRLEASSISCAIYCALSEKYNDPTVNVAVNGKTPMQWAIIENKPGIAYLLYKYGADLHMTGSDDLLVPLGLLMSTFAMHETSKNIARLLNLAQRTLPRMPTRAREPARVIYIAQNEGYPPPLDSFGGRESDDDDVASARQPSGHDGYDSDASGRWTGDEEDTDDDDDDYDDDLGGEYGPPRMI